MLFDEINGMSGNGVCNILIFPKSFTTAFHETDAANAVYNSHIMSVTGLLVIKQLRIVFSGRFTGEITFITHLNRCGRIIIGHLSILYKHTGNTIGRSCHNVMIVKAQIT